MNGAGTRHSTVVAEIVEQCVLGETLGILSLQQAQGQNDSEDGSL
jgi:hypothetical protein